MSLFRSPFSSLAVSAFAYLLASPLAAQVPQVGMGGSSLTWGDFDADGLADVYVRAPGAQDTLLLNEGDGRFTDVTAWSGLPRLDGSRQASWRNVDGDRLLDLVVVDANGAVRLFVATREAPFVERTVDAGLSSATGVQGLAWLDFDQDGRDDLQLESSQGTSLWRNASLRGQPSFNSIVLPGGGSTSPGGSVGQSGSPLAESCTPSVMDQATGNCLKASSVPSLGQLMPINQDLFVDAGSGAVGLGNLDPATRLDVSGTVRSRTGGFQFPDGSVQATATLQGPVGPAGATGAQGATGPQGPTGAMGPMGQTGSQGATGLPGLPGPTGPMGPMGVAGLDGSDALWQVNGSDMVHTGGNIGIGTTPGGSPLLLLGNGGTKPVGITQNVVGGGSAMELTTEDAAGLQATRILVRGGNDASDIELLRGASGSELTALLIRGDTGRVEATDDLRVGNDLIVKNALEVDTITTDTANRIGVSKPLDVTGELTATSIAAESFDIGSGTGTTDAPDEQWDGASWSPYQGLTVRRLISNESTDGNVVAIAGQGSNIELTLERDGTNGGLRITGPAVSLGGRTVVGTLVSRNGPSTPFYASLGETNETVAICANADDINFVHLSFGNPFQGRYHTEVTLFRRGSDRVWIGTLTSTLDQ